MSQLSFLIKFQLPALHFFIFGGFHMHFAPLCTIFNLRRIFFMPITHGGCKTCSRGWSESWLRHERAPNYEIHGSVHLLVSECKKAYFHHFYLISAVSLECYSCFPDEALGKTCSELEDAEVQQCSNDEKFCIKTVLDGGNATVWTAKYASRDVTDRHISLIENSVYELGLK